MIAAIILAGGESKRMGQPKMLLPWGATTVLGQVIGVVRSAGIQEIIVVTGADRDQIEQLCHSEGVRTVFNAGFEHEMLSSLQTGLKAAGEATEAALIVLGDQPQIQADTIRSVLGRYHASPSSLIVPSTNKRRGHPWLLGREHWAEILAMEASETPRDFLQRHADDIEYVQLETRTILEDLDTPADYLKTRP